MINIDTKIKIRHLFIFNSKEMSIKGLEVEFINGKISEKYRKYLQELLGLNDETMDIVMSLNEDQFNDFITKINSKTTVDMQFLIKAAMSAAVPLDPDPTPEEMTELFSEMYDDEPEKLKLTFSQIINVYGNELLYKLANKEQKYGKFNTLLPNSARID